ncbi:hypothetical protein C5167_031574, partial [Papaver somniferum]
MPSELMAVKVCLSDCSYRIAILVFHKVLADNLKDPLVVATFTLAVHNGGNSQKQLAYQACYNKYLEQVLMRKGEAKSQDDKCVFLSCLKLSTGILDVDNLSYQMKQNGAEKSWTKLFTIDLQKHFGGLVTDFMPLWSLKDGNIMLGLDMESRAGSFQTSVFGENQVSLNTQTYLGEVYLEKSDAEDDVDVNDYDYDYMASFITMVLVMQK